MNDDHGENPFEEAKSRSPVITLIILGLTVAGCLCLFIDIFFLFRPDKIPRIGNYFPSPTATLAPTLIPTSTPTVTATQQVIESTATTQAIQALATDSISLWPVLFSDTFDSNANDWAVGSDNDEYANVVREIKDGKYNWDVAAKKSLIAWVSPDVQAVSNFHLSAEIKRVSGSDQSDYGLVFREDVDSNLYYFGIENDGFIVLLSYDNEWTDMIEFTKSTAILPGETNRLTVIADGSHFIFFINDQYAGEMTDDHIEKGTTAIAVELYEADLQATFEFDNFELRAP